MNTVAENSQQFCILPLPGGHTSDFVFLVPRVSHPASWRERGLVCALTGLCVGWIDIKRTQSTGSLGPGETQMFTAVSKENVKLSQQLVTESWAEKESQSGPGWQWLRWYSRLHNNLLKGWRFKSEPVFVSLSKSPHPPCLNVSGWWWPEAGQLESIVGPQNGKTQCLEDLAVFVVAIPPSTTWGRLICESIQARRPLLGGLNLLAPSWV